MSRYIFIHVFTILSSNSSHSSPALLLPLSGCFFPLKYSPLFSDHTYSITFPPLPCFSFSYTQISDFTFKN